MKRKSPIVFLNELKKINPKILPLEEYRKSDEKILVRCLKCNYEWKVIPSSLLRGLGCPKCAGNMRKTDEEFRNEISIIVPNIEILEEYKGDGIKIFARCKTCNHKWKVRPNDLKNDHGCPICGRKIATIKRTKTQEEFEKEIKEKNRNIIVIGKYINANTKIFVECKTCGYKWNTLPTTLLDNHGCPKCAKSLKKTQDEFENEIRRNNTNVEIIGEYKGANKKVLTRCKICGNEWMALPQGLLHGQGCSNCNDRHTSFMEKFILISFIKVLGKEKVLSRNTSLIGKELDIYIPEYRIAFEPGSWFYHEKKRERDLEKRKDCQKKGVSLITIYDYYPSSKKMPFKDNCYVYSNSLNEPGYKRLIELVQILFSRIGMNNIILNWNQIADEAYRECRYNANIKFIEKLKEINPDIEPLEDYKGSSIPILVNNKSCEHPAWKIAPSGLYSGQGCPMCAVKRVAEKLTHSHEQFLEALEKKNPDVIVLGKYIHNKEKILVKCKICNNEWYPTPHSLLGGSGCPVCGRREANKKLTMSHEEFLNKIKKINSKIEITGEYTGVHNKIKIKCLKCGKEWETVPNSILHGHGCPNCYGNRKKTPEEFTKEMSRINNNILVIGEYKNNRTKVLVKCNKCGNEWYASPKTLIRGSGCPICARKK